MNVGVLIKEVLQQEIQEFESYLKKALINDNPRIAKIINHAFKVDGKRIRPILVFLMAKICGNVTPQTIHGAVTVELLHTATLIHDDVIDEADMRRGQPSANAVFDNKRSVLAGDYVLSSALVESVKTANLDIIRIISELGRYLAEGELNQYDLAHEVIISENEYFKVIDKKTASLLQACAQIGAISAGANVYTIANLGEVGRKMGIAFQIRDDIFDYFTNDIGKPTGNDIREGKITLPLIHALEQCDTTTRQEMTQIINDRNYTEHNIDRLLTFAKENGGIEYAQSIISQTVTEAENILQNIEGDESYKELLQLLMHMLQNRTI